MSRGSFAVGGLYQDQRKTKSKLRFLAGPRHRQHVLCVRVCQIICMYVD
jgi:hypothetical protein